MHVAARAADRAPSADLEVALPGDVEGAAGALPSEGLETASHGRTRVVAPLDLVSDVPDTLALAAEVARAAPSVSGPGRPTS